jgi:hypothetical protein
MIYSLPIHVGLAAINIKPHVVLRRHPGLYLSVEFGFEQQTAL